MLPNLGGLNSLFAGIKPNRNSAPAKQGFRSDVQIEDGDTPYDTAAEVFALVGAAGVWATLWEMTVPAQQMYSWGYGSEAFPANQGYWYFFLLDAGTGFNQGIVRLCADTARYTLPKIASEQADVALHSGTNTSAATARLIDKNEMLALPEQTQIPLIAEDSKLILKYNLIAAAAAVDTAEFKIPVTIYQ